MSPSDKNDASVNADSNDEIQHQNILKSNGMDQSPSESASFPAVDALIPEHGMVTNIPLFTAKTSTLKCSENDQMKTFDPGEATSNENVINKQCGYPLKFPLKCSNSVIKSKNYKAGSKINKLADMLAKRSQNIVEMTQNVTSDVIADIISAPKVENNSVDISDIVKAEDNLDFSDMVCEKTVISESIDSVNESPKKSVPNENSENIEKLQSQSSPKFRSDTNGKLSLETTVSEINALKECLIKSETDGSTKNKKEIRKNLKNVELSLILPEKKRRSSPRNKLVNSDLNRECVEDGCVEEKSNLRNIKDEEYRKNPRNEKTKCIVNMHNLKRGEKVKIGRQRKSKRLVETSTQTSTTDFFSLDSSKSELVTEFSAVFQKTNKMKFGAEQVSLRQSESPEKLDSLGKLECETNRTGEENVEFKNSNVSNSEGKLKRTCEEKSKSQDKLDLLKSEYSDNSEIAKLGTETRDIEKCVYACMYCTATFISRSDCKNHEKSHSPKKNKQITKCQFCNKQYPSFYDLKLHCIKNHPNKYAYCVKCDERFCEKTQLYSHNKLLHLTKAMEAAQNLVKLQETSGVNNREKNKEEIEEVKKISDKKSVKPTAPRSDLKVDVSYDSSKKSLTSPRPAQKISPRENKTEEQLLEMEMLFYSHLSGNIKENLTNHLDGKIDKSANQIQTDIVNEASDNYQKPRSTGLLSIVTANTYGGSDEFSRAPSPYQTRSKTPNPLPPTAKKFKKLPNWQQKFWEKYNFPTNYRYEHRFWDKNYLNTEKSAFYLKDLSCLDIKTQLIMRENIKKLNSNKTEEESIKSIDKLTFPDYLCLVPKISGGNFQKGNEETINLEFLNSKNLFNKDEEKQVEPSGSDVKSRKKAATENSALKRHLEKNTSKNSDNIKMMTRRQSVIEDIKCSKNEEMLRRRKGSLDIPETQKMTLRRQTSLDSLQKLSVSENVSKSDKIKNDEGVANEQLSEDLSLHAGLPEISGEWVRPRSYLCGTCCAKFTNLWELEDHKWVSHPNVWCTHYEFEDEKIDKLFHRNDGENADESGSSENSLSKLKLTDLYKRYLLPHGSLKTAKLVPNMSFPEQCTKCKKNCMSLSEMHKHMLDCGGDTTWFLTMYSSPMTIKRKWRPFGTRRRKQIGRRVVKRNIPNTSNMRSYYQHRIRTKPGDVESIQKMLANLPEKRARRAINFDEIKTRSQATIHSNRLLRKRFKVSFGTNIMRIKALKQQRQGKSAGKKESSSKSTTDTSSENTPTGSPKRRNKEKEKIQLSKEGFIFESGEETVADPLKKKGTKSRNQKQVSKQDMNSKKFEGDYKCSRIKNDKPLTRSNSVVNVETVKETSIREKRKKGQYQDNDEMVAKTENQEVTNLNLKDKKRTKDKQSKSSKSKENQKIASDRNFKKESFHYEPNSFTKSSPDSPKTEKELMKKKAKTEVEAEKERDLSVSGASEIPAEKKSNKKLKKEKLPSKDILRLKSNDKEKTEIIKRIQKTLKNSKKILEKRVNKLERRRSLRIQTLQLTDVSLKPCDDLVDTDKQLKEINEVPLTGNKTSLERDSTKRTQKMLRNLRGIYSKNFSEDTANENSTGIRRSSRSITVAFTEEKPDVQLQVADQQYLTDMKNTTSDFRKNLQVNQCEAGCSIKKLLSNENLRLTETSEETNVDWEDESVKNQSRSQNSKSAKECEISTQSGKPYNSPKTIKIKSSNKEFLDINNDNKYYDLTEMPVLDKEEPVRGRTTRKSETEIPVLMPFENEEKVTRSCKRQKIEKRKTMVTFEVINKRRKSTEKVNPLKIVKSDTSSGNAKELRTDPKTKTKPSDIEDNYKTKSNKRKRTLNESMGGRKLVKTPKTKKYFLGICPNEIDKGGNLKDESGSDSEPLITLVKYREKAETSTKLAVEENTKHSELIEISEQNKTSENSDEDPLIMTNLKENTKKETKENTSLELNSSEESMSNKIRDSCIFPRDERKNYLDPLEEDKYSETGKLESTGESLEKGKLSADESELENPIVKTISKGLKMTVKLKENTSKIVDATMSFQDESGLGSDTNNDQEKEKNNPECFSDTVAGGHRTKAERRSRRISKDIRSSSEFIIDNPWILVDELWSDLDSDSDVSKKRYKKNRKNSRKKNNENKKEKGINLEEMLRNFGEEKNPKVTTERKTKVPDKVIREGKKRIDFTHADKRKQVENRFRFEERSYKRLSLRLFRFHKRIQNFGNLGEKLLKSKKIDLDICETGSDFKNLPPLPLPFLAAEVKENPVQIIQCSNQKSKGIKRSERKSDSKLSPNMQLKISLPLQSINNLAVLNNNHLTEVLEDDLNQNIKAVKKQELGDSTVTPNQNIVEPKENSIVGEEKAEPVVATHKDEELLESSEMKLKNRRSEVIDKIFYCEICQTYYYSSSQLKIHKLSNRHKMKESELSQNKEISPVTVPESVKQNEMKQNTESLAENFIEEKKKISDARQETLDPDKLNEDTSEMPILEGPFIENPFVRLGMDTAEIPPKPSPPPSNVFGFSEDCLKDIQIAIGCTDEEMLILTLLGENSIEIENDILDLDSCRPVSSDENAVKAQNTEVKEREVSNGSFKMDFKKRITSALARLVNKAVLNLLQKYKNTNKTGISPEELSFLIKLSKVNNKKNLLELDELLKKESEGESSNRKFNNEDDNKGHIAYKYLCTICGAQFQQESIRKWHIVHFHKSEGMKNIDELSADPVLLHEDDKEDKLTYKYLCTICGARFQKESIRECHILRAHRNKITKSIEEPTSGPNILREDYRKEQNIPYKYLCTICGSRFQKESTWECHIKRSHKSKGKKNMEDVHVAQSTFEDDWSNTWTYDINDELLTNVETPQFLCSDCGINFISPQEVLEHQKLEHAGQKESDINENGPLQSSTIGSSDEIIKGKRTPRRGPKHLSKAELDQQRILANNELRKLDRKFCNKNKANKIKWGMDALKFTVEKENKDLTDKEKEISVEETSKHVVEPKNIDIIPKLNLSRTNNIPEFKVVQKTSCLNRFQRILDNKMKRKSTRNDMREMEEKSGIVKEFVEPLAVVQKERKRKPNRFNSKKGDVRKVFDVYDFNDSESEPEPVAFSHIKKVGPPQITGKTKLFKFKGVNETSKNKADSTTNDLGTEDYDSEDSLPLSVVKKTRNEDDDEEARTEDQVEKPEGILEKVEYLIEQLEHETKHSKSEEDEKDIEEELTTDTTKSNSKRGRNKRKLDIKYTVEQENVDSQPEAFRISLENKFLQLESIVEKKNPDFDENTYESHESRSSGEKVDEGRNEKSEDIFPVADSSQGISDEEDSLPLVLISKKNDTNYSDPNIMYLTDQQKSERVESPRRNQVDDDDEEEEEERKDSPLNEIHSPKVSLESGPTLSSNENEELSGKSDKSYETLNGNVIYRRNDSMSGFDSDTSDYEPLYTEKSNGHEMGENLIKEVMEKEDVVIVCSKKEQDTPKTGRKKSKDIAKKKKQNNESVPKKKKILPLLSVTLEENNFRKSESPKMNKDVIMKKIWSRRKFPEDDVIESDNSLSSRENDISNDNTLNDDSQSEIDKEIIMKKIWNKKKLDQSENGEVQVTKPEDLKINQTEISNEVVIKCGPKAKATPKRRKIRATDKESSKERIMRKIWSGKCTFQTKAALKTYDSDIYNSKDKGNLEEQYRVKRRGRPPNFMSSKKTKVQSDGEKSDEDDLDSLLEEIEREDVEKAIRLEFLQLRRSDKANAEGSKESGSLTVGLFAETCHKQGRELPDKRRKRIRRNVKHPRKNLLKRRKFIKKPNVKQQQTLQTVDIEGEGNGGLIGLAEDSLKTDPESLDILGRSKSFDLESNIKIRKHKKHRHKHHHHKHKHKKSKHHKYIIGKHKIKHKSIDSVRDKPNEFENFSILEKMCQEIPSKIDKQPDKRFTNELDTLDTKLDEILMSTSSSLDGKAKECDPVHFQTQRIDSGRAYDLDSDNIYEFVDEDSGFLCESKGKHKN